MGIVVQTALFIDKGFSASLVGSPKPPPSKLGGGVLVRQFSFWEEASTITGERLRARSLPNPEQPNVLLIMSDQHHPRRMGCAGDPLIRTPAMDRLAAGGVRCSSAYCNFPLCGPSRMSFMTSQYASGIDCLFNSSQLASGIPTFAHGFAAAGYETVLAGRMHFVGPDQRHGFEKRIIGDVSPTAYGYAGYKTEPVLGELLPSANNNAVGLETSGPGLTGYQAFDEAVCDRTVQWLQARDAAASENRPFLLVAGFMTPHAPFVAPPEDFAWYHERMTSSDLPEPHLDRLHPIHRELRRRFDLDRLDPIPFEMQLRTRAAYYALCTFTDRLVGRILGALEQTDLASNTLTVYTSDHGEHLGEHGLWWKCSFYEASAGVPMILSWPGHLPAGGVVPGNVSLLDLGPTLLDLAGAPALPGADGRSFRCLLEGDEQAWPDQVIAESGNFWNDRKIAQRMIRHGPWKLNVHHGMKPQLFQIEEDAGELHDRVDDPVCRDVVCNLEKRLREGWDPDDVERRMALRMQELPLLAEWARRTPLPEPDPPWFDTPPVNGL